MGPLNQSGTTMTSKIRAAIRSTPILGPIAVRTFHWLKYESPYARADWLARRRIMKRDDLLNFWQTEAPEGNVPADYIAPVERSEALLKLVQFLPADARILEVGCNVGRNLAFLFNAGYRNVEGVEISPHAVNLLRETFPELDGTTIHLGAAEDVLPTLETAAFDLVFTMAVMEHIHPDSSNVFDDIARLSDHVLAIEPTRRHATSRQYPHDPDAIFRSRGFRLASATPMTGVPGLATYTARLFERSAPG